MNTVIIGAGISGLSTANFLSKKTSDFLIIESSNRIGGIINSSKVDGYILENGRVVMDGPAQQLRENPDVKEFYLGMSDEGRKSFRDVRSYRRRKRWLS